MSVQKLEYGDEVYYYINGKFVDSSYVEVVPAIKNELVKLIFKEDEYKTLRKSEMLPYINKLKVAGNVSLVKTVCEYCLEKYMDTEYLIRTILPTLTSCYRACGESEKVVNIVRKYNLSLRLYDNAVFYTSLGAAYCDIGDFVRAKKVADKAFAVSNGNGSEELIMLYRRIKKLSGE